MHFIQLWNYDRTELSSITVIRFFDNIYTKNSFNEFIRLYWNKSQLITLPTNTQFLIANLIDCNFNHFENNWMGSFSLSWFKESIFYSLISLIELDGLHNYSISPIRDLLYQKDTIIVLDNFESDFSDKIILSVESGSLKSYKPL